MLFSACSTRGARSASGSVLLLLTLSTVLASHPPISTSEQPAGKTPSSIVPPWVRHQQHRQAAHEHGHAHGHHVHDEHDVRRSAGSGGGGEGGKLEGREGHRCMHDQTYELASPSPQKYSSQGRRAGGQQPLRITFEYEELDTDARDPALNAYIKKLMFDAQTWLSSALSVTPIEGPLYVTPVCFEYFTQDRNNYKCATLGTPLTPTCGKRTIPAKFLGSIALYDKPSSTPTVTPAQDGAADSDVLVFVTMKTDAVVCSGGSTIAYASHCQRDQNDRPTVGHINWCPELMMAQGKTTKDIADDLDTAIHEILHVLGFSEPHFAFWRDSEGTPRTARCPAAAGCDMSRDFPGDPPIETVSGGVTYRIDSETVATSTERGVSGVKRLVTPEAKNAAREHFGCDTVAGPELENDGGSGTMTSHFEQRTLFTELMTGQSSSFNAPRSILTLAAMQDSGWYSVNYTMAQKLIWGNEWGCDFASAKCLTSGNEENFCAVGGEEGCTFDRSGVGYCGLSSYPDDLPSYYQYFNDPTKGGSKALMDYCPVMSKYSNKHCNNDTGSFLASSWSGESAGPGRACFGSSLLETGFSNGARALFGCYRFSCSGTELTLYGPDGTEHGPCTANQQFKVPGYGGFLTCPADPAGFCDDNSGQTYIPVSPQPSGSVDSGNTVNAGSRLQGGGGLGLSGGMFWALALIVVLEMMVYM